MSQSILKVRIRPGDRPRSRRLRAPAPPFTVNPPTLRTYAGYTQDELKRGKPAVIVS
jgi:hypothetical protein